MSTLMIFSALTLLLLFLAILKLIHAFVFKKKVVLIRPDFLASEISRHQRMEHQVLLIFEGGYWEIKEEEHSKEWSQQGGTQNFIDLDNDIDDKRYHQFMDKRLTRDKEGHHELRIIKELELNESTQVDDILNLKI